MVQLIHAKAVNLARRLSVQNENDLLQEPFFDTEDDDTKKFTHDFCANLASHLVHVKNLPPQCKKYTDVVHDLEKRDKDTSHPTQWLA